MKTFILLLMLGFAVGCDKYTERTITLFCVPEQKSSETAPEYSEDQITEIVTNTWETALRKWESGTNIVGYSKNPGWLLTNVCSFGVGAICITNSLMCYECTRDHVDEYPKTSKQYYGVQEHVTTKFFKNGDLLVEKEHYEYPFLKRLVEVTTAIEFVVTTNLVDVTE